MNVAVKISRELCKGCGQCVRQCVSGSLRLAEGVAVYDPAECIHCGGCEAVCPHAAVRLVHVDASGAPFEGSLNA